MRCSIRSVVPALALALVAIAGCGRPGPRLVVIGIDGLEWTTLRPLIEAGELPTFARFVNEGAPGELESELPLLSPILWTTIATGLSPDRHRVLDFTSPRSDETTAVVSSLDRRCKAYWNILDEAGISTGTIGWWATWPAEPLDAGFIVSDRVRRHAFLAVATPDGGLVHPPELTGLVLDQLGDPGRISYPEARRFLDVGPDEFDAATGFDYTDPIAHFRHVLTTMDDVARIARALDERERPRVLSVYFEGLDTAGHLYGRYTLPVRAGATDEQRRRFGGAVDAFYRHQDALLAGLMKTVGDAVYLIVSDHGFLTGDDRPRSSSIDRMDEAAPEWHRREGVILALGSGIEPGTRMTGARIRDVAPTILALTGVPPSDEMPGRVLPDLASEPGRRVATYEDAAWLERRDRALVAPDLDDDAMRRLEALGYLSASSSTARLSARSQVNLGSYYQGQGDQDQARRAYRDALTIDPTNPRAHGNLGRMLATAGDCAGAREHLAAAVAADSDDFASAYWLVRCLATEGRMDAAIELGRRVVADFPEEAVIRRFLGLIYRLNGQPDQAKATLLAAIDLNPTDGISWRHLADTYVDLGERQEAVRCFRRTLELRPGDTHATDRLNALGEARDR